MAKIEEMAHERGLLPSMKMKPAKEIDYEDGAFEFLRMLQR